MGKTLSTLTKPRPQRIFWRFHKPLDASKNEIRVMIVHDADDDAALVRCTIDTVSLDTNCEYVALSCVWGTGANANIIVNNQMFHVTVNLALALRHLRKAYRNTGKLVLWVDAVCIDQLDLNERAQQVRIMGQIYRKAKEVAIWLGEEIPHAQHAFDFIQAALHELKDFAPQGTRSRNEMRHHFVYGDHGFLDKWFGSAPTRLRCQYLQAIDNFLSIQWFKRVWTIQEAVLNKRVAFYIMSFYIEIPSIELLCTAVSLLNTCRTIHLSDSSSTEDEMAAITKFEEFIGNRRTHSVDALLSAQVYADTAWTNENSTSLVHSLKRQVPLLFANCAQRLATDDRDKVYGLLGLIGKDLDLLPDYSSPVGKVYEDATFAFLKWTGSLSFMYKCYTPSSVQMPTWAFDFRSRLGNGYQNPECNDTDHLFNCSLGLEPVMLHPRAGILGVRGRTIDRVNRTLRFDRINTPVQTKQAIDQVMEFCVGGCNDMSALSSHDQLAIWRLLCGGAFGDLQTFYIRHFLAKDAELFSHEYRSMNTPGYTDEALVSDYISSILRRSVVFCTDGGRYGVGRMDVEQGDLLTMLQGAEMPCMLRTVNDIDDKTFTFRGGCYVDGRSNSGLSCMRKMLTD